MEDTSSQYVDQESPVAGLSLFVTMVHLVLTLMKHHGRLFLPHSTYTLTYTTSLQPWTQAW